MSADHTCRGESYAVDCAGKICQCTNMSGGRAVCLILFDLHACLAAMQSVVEWAEMFNKGQGEPELRVCHAPCQDVSPPRTAQTSAICQHTHGKHLWETLYWEMKLFKPCKGPLYSRWHTP